jgi:3-hydroxyisobutyrate dehydrogenase
VDGTIGVIGVGRMGAAVLENLAATGNHEVLASDVDAKRRPVVEGHGAGWVAKPAALAEAADVLLTILPGSPELTQAMEAVIPALRGGSTWIDMTSAAPPVGLELMARAAKRGVECLDAPIGGTPEAVRGGTAQLFVGGEETAIRRIHHLLARLGRPEHVGQRGTGYTVKLLINLLWFTQAISVTEALLLARRQGIELTELQPILNRSAAASAFTAKDLDRLLQGDSLETFGLDRCCEEVEATVALADAHGVPFELSRLVADVYGRALARYGPVDGELLPVAMLEERADLKLR